MNKEPPFQKQPPKITQSYSGLIPIPFEHVKREWVSHFKEIEKKLEKTKQEWNAFESEAKVLFQSWYHSTFAKHLNLLREIDEESNRIKRTLDAIEAQIGINGLSRAEACKKVSLAIKESHDPFPSDEEFAEYKERQKKSFHAEFAKKLSQGGKHIVDEERLEELREETIAQAMHLFGRPENPRESHFMQNWINNRVTERYKQGQDESVTKKAPPDEVDSSKENQSYSRDSFFDEEELLKAMGGLFGEDTENGENVNFGQGNPAEQNTVRLKDYKSIYRQIVRLLHPDRGSPMNETEKELWSQAQVAYGAREAESLHAILLRIEGGGQIDVLKLQSIGDIRELTLALHFEYREINYIKSQVKKDPLYRFWASRKRPTNRKKLEVQMSFEFKNQIHYYEHELKELRSHLRRIEREIKQK